MAKSEIYALMKTLTAQGISIVMISSELPEITGLCGRVLVFNHGHVVATLAGREIEAGTIMTHATRQISLDNPTGAASEPAAAMERAS